MTREDYYTILDLIDDQIEKEKKLCEGYVKLNPDDKGWREQIRDGAISGLISARIKIVDRFKKNLSA